MSLHTGDLRTTGVQDAPLTFLWLELTNRCNLACTHCYAESGPYTGSDDVLTAPEYVRLMQEAHDIGCPAVQFIGGEPTLYPALPFLISEARRIGMSFVEVFTNLVTMRREVLDAIVEHGVHVATSVYGPCAEIHDAVTTRPGSHARTIRNLRRLVGLGVPVRAGVIEMDANRDHVNATVEFLHEIGVDNVGGDRLRGFGRGRRGGGESDLGELCGACASGTLRIGPDGAASPCIMSCDWTVGNVREASLADIVAGRALRRLRRQIYVEVVAPRERAGGMQSICDPKTCAPYGSCQPKWGPGPCEPSSCTPCYPKGAWPARDGRLAG